MTVGVAEVHAPATAERIADLAIAGGFWIVTVRDATRAQRLDQRGEQRWIDGEREVVWRDRSLGLEQHARAAPEHNAAELVIRALGLDGEREQTREELRRELGITARHGDVVDANRHRTSA